jgi:hypothetical protein
MQPEYNIVLECTVTDTAERQCRLGRAYACILGSDESEYGLVREALTRPKGHRQRRSARHVAVARQDLIAASV